MNYLTVDKSLLINSLSRYIFQILFIIVISVLSALTFNYFRADGITVFPRTISTPKLTPDDSGIQFDKLSLDAVSEEHKLGKSIFIDARSHDFYILGHIKGAINIPANRFDDFFDNALKNVAVDRGIIVYCDSFNCDLAEEVAIKLFSKGFNNIKIFEEGWEKWFEAFLPIEEG